MNFVVDCGERTWQDDTVMSKNSRAAYKAHITIKLNRAIADSDGNTRRIAALRAAATKAKNRL